MNTNTGTKTKKVVINACYGGFGLSVKAAKLYNEYKGENVLEIDEDFVYDVDTLARDDPILVRVVEELSDKILGTKLKIVTVKDEEGWDYRIGEYDGSEWIEEQYTPIPVELIISHEFCCLKKTDGTMLPVPKESRKEFLALYSIIDIIFTH